MKIKGCFLIIWIMVMGQWAWAEGDEDVAPSHTAAHEPSPAKRKVKGKQLREKETEGTEALDRFQADTVIKSQYELNGQPLEVDPD